jgi:hypothetical protein
MARTQECIADLKVWMTQNKPVKWW